MSTATTLPHEAIDSKAAARRSFLLVFLCTLIGALAQMLIKDGSKSFGTGHLTVVDVLHSPGLIFQYGFGILSNVKLFVGYLLYGVNVILMALALKGRELSRMFPIIALTYVWVTFLSVTYLHEHVNFFRVMGVIFIVGGVSVLGLSKTSPKEVA